MTDRFLVDVSKLVAGNGLALLIVFMVSPILTRVYRPTDFGAWSVFTSVSGVLAVIMTLRYEFAIVLPKDDDNGRKVLVLCALVICAITAVLVVLVSIWGNGIAGMLGVPEIREWLWLLPVNVSIMGLCQITGFWRSRREQFGVIAGSKITQSVGNAGSQLALSLAKGLGPGGLILGQLIGHLAGFAYMLHGLRIGRWTKVLASVSPSELAATAVRYRRFPLMSTWAALLNATALHSPAILLAYYFGPAVAGFYALGNRVLQVPLHIFGQSISEVFFLQAAREKNATGWARRTVEQTFIYLLALGLPTLIALIFFAPPVFEIAFGSDWYEAGKIVQLLAPALFLRFLSVPMGAVTNVFERQDIVLIWQAAFFGATLTVLIVGGLARDLYYTIGLLACLQSVLYSVLLVIVFVMSGASLRGVLRKTRGTEITDPDQGIRSKKSTRS